MCSRKGKGWRGGFVGSALEKYIKVKTYMEDMLRSVGPYGDFAFPIMG